ncbi:MAG: bifunctional 5,10-methylenetetrahydrofolate dehydrogenase/5,10-methenyltetrahydrofolate cyclohydrolase [Acidobacteriota bacterium]
MGEWLRGDLLAEEIKAEIQRGLESYKEKIKRPPYLVGILIGENPSSKIYLNIKKRECEKIGIKSEIVKFSEDETRENILNKINELNDNRAIDGILVQLPIPSHLDTLEIISALSPDKDVDGFHPDNVSRIFYAKPGFRPCTPFGILELLKRNNIKIEGKRAVIIGRSFIVGKPLGLMLLNENATLTFCHSKTENLKDVTSSADILIVAIGKPCFVRKDFVKQGAVVVDVGINQITDLAEFKRICGDNEKKEVQIKEKGSTLVGDVHPEVIEKASFLTPVPGGVGPLTVAMLLKNTWESFRKRENL